MADVAQTFSIDPYSAENARLSRQQKLAEILQQQALQPDQQFSYAGIQAPASAAGALAKGLQSGISGYMMGRSMKGQEDLISKASEDTKSATEALVKGLSAKPWQNPDAGAVGTAPIYQPGASGLRDANDPAPQPQMMPGADQSTAAFKAGPAGSYSGALASLGDLPDNPQAQRLAQSLLMKKLEKDSATTKLGPDEKVYDARGNLLFGNEPRSQSALGKLADDYKNGRITKAEYDAGVSKETNLSPTAVINNVGPNAYVTELSQGLAKADLGKLEKADSAPERIATSGRIFSIIDSDKSITGPLADIKLNIARGLDVVGGGEPERIVATEALISELARVTMQSIKSSGLGAGAGFTDTDRAFLEKAAAGNIDYKSATIRRLAVLNDKAARLDIKQGNEARARAAKQPGLEHLLAAAVAMPGEYAPPAGAPGGEFVPQPDGSLNWVPNANR